MATKRDKLARAETALMRANNRIRTRMPSYPKTDNGIAHQKGATRLRGRRGSRDRARSNRIYDAIMRDSEELHRKYGGLVNTYSQPSGGTGTNS